MQIRKQSRGFDRRIGGNTAELWINKKSGSQISPDEGYVTEWSGERNRKRG